MELAKRRGHQGIASLVNGVLRSVLRQPEVWSELPNGGLAAQIAFEESHPEWLVQRWLKQYGADTTRAICRENNLVPHASVRVNSLKLNREKLLAELQTEFAEVSSSPLSPYGILLGGGFAAGSRWFREGYCTIQDESSMLVAPALHPRSGQRVLDACAAPGGKTTHIAELMNNQGEIVACDVHPHKRELIELTADRLGIGIIKTVVS
ncbi:hypothetical protein MXD63_37070, partial [Frankia sp. Cpl3]|nr:hypothetical protein [Frankia sp. Cpl3]